MKPHSKVVNIKNEPCDIYIGRGSKWGNPFLIGIDGSREEVVNMYAEWVVKQEHLMNDIESLIGKRLGCFCKPKLCHGDVLLNLLRRL